MGPGDTLTNILIDQGVNGTGNNFAELPAGSLSGSVYWDVNHNGVMDSADFGIVNVTITLDGVDNQGLAVHATTLTDTNGAYGFLNLRAGTYSLTETQPTHFRDYKDNVGTLGGQAGNDQISSIVVSMGASGEDYNFGELQKPGCRLRSLAFNVGNMVSRDLAARSKDPARFDRNHPKVGPLLAQGQVPRGVGGYPRGPLAYWLVPTLGTKRLVWRQVPATHKRSLIGIPNFPTSAARSLARAATPHRPGSASLSSPGLR